MWREGLRLVHLGEPRERMMLTRRDPHADLRQHAVEAHGVEQVPLVSAPSTDAAKPAKSCSPKPTRGTSGNRHTIVNGRMSSSAIATGGPSSVHSIASPSTMTTRLGVLGLLPGDSAGQRFRPDSRGHDESPAAQIGPLPGGLDLT
jgi:hypothetical protein